MSLKDELVPRVIEVADCKNSYPDIDRMFIATVRNSPSYYDKSVAREADMERLRSAKNHLKELGAERIKRVPGELKLAFDL